VVAHERTDLRQAQHPLLEPGTGSGEAGGRQHEEAGGRQSRHHDAQPAERDGEPAERQQTEPSHRAA
jgi:hypothetical protein